MSTDFKDYYATLGITAAASENEIKQAFRALARKYHPDVAAEKKTAEEKFKAINEANEVLGDPLKRKKYDELRARWQASGSPEASPPDRSAGGTGVHFHGTGFSDFFEQFFGGPDRADYVDGAGFDFGAEAPPGRGVRRGHDIEGDILVTLAEVLHGTVRELSVHTFNHRTGADETHSFAVRIPPGATQGRRIRVGGKGAPGLGGGEAGDLFLRVRYAAHPDLRVRDADLFCDAVLAPWEAALGAHIVVPSLEGPIKVHVPAGTNPGRQLRVRGHGLPKGRTGARGDLFVVTQIEVPTTMNDDERARWKELAQSSRFAPRERRT